MANQHFTPNELKTEEWRDVPGYEGWYQVSNIGRVRGVDRWIVVRGARGGPRLVKGKMMTQRLHRNGYMRVRLCKHNLAESVGVHSLVACAFLGDRPTGYDIHHKDGSRTNNRADNLEYRSRQEHLGGEMHYRTSLTDEDVIEIRRLYESCDLSVKDIADKKGITYGAAQSIINGSNWKHLPITKRLHLRTRGSKNPCAKLTEDQIGEIRNLLKDGFRQTDIAERFGVRQTTISDIALGKRWKHVC
jgi:predicted DNA-binding protein YlxM (UPF0122 family)